MFSTVFNRVVLAASVCLAVGLAVGCGGVEADYEKLGLVDISGTVKLDGSPVAGAVVKFITDADKTYCYGQTDAQGRYTLKLNSEKEGVIPGPKRVEISTLASTGEEEGSGEEEDPDAVDKSKKEAIPACYNKSSQLTVTVTDSDSEFDFELQSDCSTTTNQ